MRAERGQAPRRADATPRGTAAEPSPHRRSQLVREPADPPERDRPAPDRQLVRVRLWSGVAIAAPDRSTCAGDCLPHGPARMSAWWWWVMRVEPLRLEWIEALIDGDAAFTERFGIAVIEGWAGFLEALPHALDAARRHNVDPWGSHLF